MIDLAPAPSPSAAGSTAVRHRQAAPSTATSGPHARDLDASSVIAAGPSRAVRLPDPDAEGELERLGDEIAELAAHITAATYRLLVLIAAFDRRFRQAGGGTGFRSTAHWLSWRVGLGLNAARERVRVARALEGLPKISAEMRRGALSFSKARALTRVATPENEAELMEFALHGTAAHVERLVRAWRRVDRQVAAEEDAAAVAEAGGEAAVEAMMAKRRRASRHLSLWADDDGTWVLRARLEPEAGAALRRALKAAREALFREERRRSRGPEASGGDGGCETPEQRRADALGLLAERALSGGALEAAGATSPGTGPGDGSDGEGGGSEVCGSEGCGSGTGGSSGRAGGSPARLLPCLPLSGLRAERYQVVVHVDAEALQEESTSGAGPGSARIGAAASDGSPAPDPASERPRHVTAVTSEAESNASPETSEIRPPPSSHGSRAAPGLSGVAVAPGAFLDDGARLPVATARRLACDAGRVVQVHGRDGSVLDVGRRTRTIPTALRRALEHRDAGCVFPGCGNRITDGHHLRHWIDGGETTLDNLVLLCRRHHRLVHEAGFGVELVEDRRDPEGKRELRFLRPDGRPLPAAPPAPPVPGGDETVASLVDQHRRLGIAPDRWTPTPPGIGERLDLGLAIDLMWRHGGAEGG